MDCLFPWEVSATTLGARCDTSLWFSYLNSPCVKPLPYKWVRVRVNGGPVFWPVVAGLEPPTHGWGCMKEESPQPLSCAYLKSSLFNLELEGMRNAGSLLHPVKNSWLGAEGRGSPVFLGTLILNEAFVKHKAGVGGKGRRKWADSCCSYFQ